MIFLLALGGLVSQLAVDTYSFIYSIDCKMGWIISFSALFIILLILIYLVNVELKSIFMLISLRKQIDKTIILNNDHICSSIILLISSVLFIFQTLMFSIINAGVYNSTVQSLPDFFSDAYIIMGYVLDISLAVLIIVIVVKVILGMKK